MTGLKVSGVFNPYEVYGQKKTASSIKAGKTEDKKDVVALSEQAKDYQALTRIMTEVPDVRADVVSGVKSRYESGSYNVPSEDIAVKLINKWAALD